MHPEVSGFYGPAQAAIHHERFGALARRAAAVLVDELRAADLPAGLVTDLGCGTGVLATALVAAGYDVEGLDISAAMVALARANAPAARFRVASVFDHELALAPSVAVTALGEVFNYAVDQRVGLDSLRQVASRVRAALAPGGVFLFDVSLPGRNLGQAVRHQFHDGGSWALGMLATESDGRLTRRITIFVERPDGGFERVDETHELVLYDESDVVGTLLDAGFAVTTAADYGDGPGIGGWRVFCATPI